jgi:acyl carrier protein
MLDEKTFYGYIGKMFGKDAGDLGPETRLREDLNATSQMYFGVSALLEKLTGKKTNFADINNCSTLADVIDMAQK